MKKKILLVVIILLIFLVVKIINIKSYNMNPLKNIEISSIKEITIYNPAEGFTIVEKDDIQILFNSLQSMKLREKSDNKRSGFAFLISIKLNSEEIIDISILYLDIVIGNQNYSPAKDYCASTRIIFDELAKKYLYDSE